MAQLADDAPEGPWALYLADLAHRYRLLGLDFDDHAATGEAAVHAAQLSELLDREGIPHLVCASGGHAGRHVWIRLDGEGISAAEARATAAVLKTRWPSLDPGPLQNPAWGCLRPPGAPHKHGGHARPLSDVDAWLETPPASTAAWQHLAAAIATDLPDALPTTRPAPSVLPVDVDGHRHLPGPRRQLSTEVRDALDAPVDHRVDASARLRTVLVGAAAARWTLVDVTRELLDRPGLTHARSVRGPDGHTRIPRSPEQTRALLARQWARALPRAATAAVDVDQDFVRRAGQIAEWVDALQTRADVCVGRWTSRGGPADRRVLDALCEIAVASVKATVDADIRRLALMTGLGRETVRRALHRLSDHIRGEDWIILAKPSVGTLAATWKIDPQSAIHTTLEESGSQVRPGGVPTGPDDELADDVDLLGTGYRAALLAQLRTRNANLCHDVFTPRQIPTLTANFYARIPEDPQLSTLHERFGPATSDLLALLQDLGLIIYSDGTPRHSIDPAALQRAAHRLDVDGVLERRAERYRVERLVRTWFDLEVEWLRTAQAQKRGRKHLPPDQTWLVPPTAADLAGYRYPRRPNGEPDHAAAAALLDATTTPQHQSARRRTATQTAEAVLRAAFVGLELVA